ncbi:hypothetical protein Dxin01_02205 [Deinococcus xinjiangensis]|uniref:Fido domain-containing protein n=1 Tax=Deinococcus xinjiangensis TaxID=457454 RepID=A0ABP9VCV5_9DEIO
MTVYLSAEQVLALHDRALHRYGGTAGVRDSGALASSVAQPAMEAFGMELYPDLETKAAAYLFFLSRNHVFTDGNKRTAYLAAAIFLRLNGLSLAGPDDQVFELVLASARGELKDVDAVTERLKPLISPL